MEGSNLTARSAGFPANASLTQFGKERNLCDSSTQQPHSFFTWCIALFQARLCPFAPLWRLPSCAAVFKQSCIFMGYFILNIQVYACIVEI